MKRCASSVLAERIKQRRAVTRVKHKVRHVKFSPEGVAYDIPDDTSGIVLAGRGSGSVFAKPAKGPTMVRLDSDVAKMFKDSRSVNRALRKLIEAMPVPTR